KGQASTMTTFLHLTERALWEQGLAAGEYRRQDLIEDGFIHCLTAETLVRVANKYYRGALSEDAASLVPQESATRRGRPELVLLVIEESRVTSPVKWEPASDGKLYPHIYGPLNPDAVVAVRAYAPGPAGEFGPLE
ncbi:MAG TPA: DUF952 domain-containing protein, partial [Symbiobacteriaceae bacterium]|nr:DUF952 domain-containing protein [Symbiobacteriaceae bacterium]